MAGEIFISYRRADQAWARHLHAQLKAQGVEAWYDALVGAGQDWRIATAKALETSQIFVLLFSENAAQSTDIAKELAAAVLEKKLIVPVRLEDIAPKGAFLYELASRNWINAYDDTGNKLAELAKGLAEMVRTGVRDESVLPFERSDGDALAQRRRRKYFLAVAMGAAALAVLGTATRLLVPARHWTAENSRRFVYSLEAEGTPAFSPDGKMLAYTAGTPRKIYAKSLTGGDAVRVTDDAFDAASLSWASDGSHLAYVGLKRGESCRLMVTTVPAGQARQVGRCGIFQGFLYGSVVWRPNTPFLYYFDQKNALGRYIARLNLDTGERSEIRRPQQWLWAMSASPDGKWLLFLDLVKPLTFRVVIHELESGKEKELGLVMGDFAGTADGWSEDSRAVFVTVGGTGNQTVMAYPIDGSAPYNVYSTSTNIYGMAVGTGGRLALESDLSLRNLARLVPAPTSQPDIIDPASGTTRAPTFAPDGTLAFLSNRSGGDAIWIKKPGGAPERLLDGNGALLRSLRFSPDGTQLAVTSIKPKISTVKILTADGGDVAAIEVKMMGIGSPTWTPDGKSLIMLDETTNCYARVEIARPALRTKLPNCEWDGIVYRSDGVFGIRNDKPGIWRNLDGTPQLLNAKYASRFEPAITFSGEDVLVPQLGIAGAPAQLFAQPIAGGPDRLLGYAPGGNNSGGFAANPITREVLYTADVGRDSNIDLLTLVRH